MGFKIVSSLKVFDKQLDAVKKAQERTVRSASLAAQDGMIDALKKNVDRPKDFTVNRRAFIAAAPKWEGSVVSSFFTIAAKQAAYLRFIMGVYTTRVPGDPGAGPKRIWTPPGKPGDKAGRDQYGGLNWPGVRAAAAESKLSQKKLRRRQNKSAFLQHKKKHGSEAGFVAPKLDGNTSRGFFFKKRTTKSGKVVYGFWKRPGRIPGTSKNVGKLSLAFLSSKLTHHQKKFDYNAIMEAAHRKAVREFPRRLKEELGKRGLR